MSPFLTPPPPTTLHLAVIGAGAAGLAAARELLRSGHSPTIFERSASVGGVWNYTPTQESDLLSLDPNRTIVHSSLYSSLRTNLPREVMGFLDYPFSGNRVGAGDRRRFPGHREVLRYLRGFAEEFGLGELVKFEREVVRVERMGDGKWVVKSRFVGDGGDVENEVFDGVVVCNGHYCEPRIAEINGVCF